MENLHEIFYRVWFPKDTQEITIIGATDFEDLKRGQINYENLALIDGMGDRDAIFNIGLLLSRRYPNARIHLELSHNTEIRGYNFRKNLVIVGGPGGDEYYNTSLNQIIKDPNNHACRRFSDFSPPTKIRYTNDAQSLICENDLYTSEYQNIIDEQGKLSKSLVLDYGYFSAFPNDYDESKFRVVMIHGIHTLGVLGASKVFDDDTDRDTLNNFRILKERVKDDEYSFETFFKVRVDGFTVFNPQIDSDKVFLYNEPGIFDKTTHEVFLSHSSKDRDLALKIKKELEEKNMSVFMAPWGMELGDWEPQLKAKIRHEALKILVLVLTKNSQESPVVNLELKTALNERKEVICYQPEKLDIQPTLDSWIRDKHNILAYQEIYPDPIQELVVKVKQYLDKSR
ncbi:hypothetical protein FHS57_005081 [Runella defluvii]|uniref:TIR domain-containing protein n=1 Tax=Runella defluvii TaxID=370973 RepID=A0A7W5ZQS5_9BACT|nr:toll/interleukin-1 receptor domain-containing protein [Runella defluvii]MBB3841060.1 hypothetical protein [Runella defluvii]